MTTDEPARLAQMGRALSEQRVRAASWCPSAEPQAVASRTASGPLPLSASQAQLWYLSQLAPDSRALNELIEIHKTGALDVEALRRALSTVVSRHEVWRTTFACVDGVPHQFVHEPIEIDLPLVDLSHLSAEEAERRATEIATADTQWPYDLARGPLIRPRLIRITDGDHRLYLAMHQLIFDGVTLQRVLLPELIAAYRAYATGQAFSLPEPEAQYSDYTIWQRDWLSGPTAAARIARWRGRLAGVTPTQLPIDHPQPAGQRFAGGTIPLTIDHATVEGLRGAARRAGGTFFHALAAAYAWWLHRYTESTDVVFGTAHDLRWRKNLLTVAGNCVTPVVVRCEVTGQETFIELMDRVGGVVTEALSDAVPFETLLAELGVPRDPRNNPLFQTALKLVPPTTSPADDWSLHLIERDVADVVGSPRFDIEIELDERPDGHFAGRLMFSTDLFEHATVRAMAAHWVRLLQAVAAAPDIPIAQHDLVTKAERRRQLSWNPAAPQGISSQCVHEIIRAQTERTPDSVAVQVGDEALTYRQLDDRAEDIAARLLAAGAGTGTVVAVLLDRKPDLVAALLGILKSGAAFLALDPRQPAARNAFNINDAGAAIILTDRQLPTGEETVMAKVINLSDPWPARPALKFNQSVAVSPVDLAYVTYTSGSTGRPKGVLVEHRGLANVMLTMFGEFGVTGSDTVLSPSSISFDAGLADVFCALACGARLVLATVEEATSPDALSRLIAGTGANYMMTTPTLWEALVAVGWNGDPRLTVVSVGETLTEGLAEALLQRCPAVWNGYGPTEATIGSNFARLAKGDTVTVGRPLPNVRVYVVDSRGRMQPVGVPGQIVIGGVGVARGYLNRPDEHARRFGDDPFHVGGRIYRTGDRGRFLPDGRIQYLGRYDDQVKIRGIRVEPDEIASTLAEHPDVGRCAVVAREAPSGGQQLVAYIVGEPRGPSDAEARGWLRHRLPEYMVPSAFVHLGAFPMTASGKLDKAALPAPSPLGVGRPGDQCPRSDMERRVAELWADVLGVPVTDVNSDFFDVGGHSLLALRLIAKIQRTFGVPLPLAVFLDSGRTIAGLAELLSAENPSRTDEVASGPPLHFIFADHPSAMTLRHFTAQWGAAQPVHALIPEQRGGRFDRSLSIEQHASQALSAIRDRQPDGPLALVGYSIGGLLAYEVARQAVDAGQQVDWLGILDTEAPSMAQRLRAQLTLRWQLRRLRQQPARERWAKCAEVALRVLRGGPGALWPQHDFDYRGATEIVCRYQQPGHEVPMHLFVSEASVADAGADLLGWDEFHRGTLTVHRLAGDHGTLLDLPEVNQLARMMFDSLGTARASLRVDAP
ncbi:MAG: non-ribosomal peptide synthetase [Mycobacterium sp.]|uniref:non-ribosomal peptide synthetase n=1 Tax=Mycobacterium sp. TaxID=1785 RepID=UPI003F9E94FA